MKIAIAPKVNKHQMPKIRLTEDELVYELTQHLFRLKDKDLAKVAEMFFGKKFEVAHSSSGSYYFSMESNKRLNKYLIESIDMEILAIATQVFNQQLAIGEGLTNLKTKIRMALITNGVPFSESLLVKTVDTLTKGAK